MEQSLTARNACLLLSQARLFSEPALIQRAWEVIDAQAEMALTSDAFADIDFDTLMSILSRETLNCKETVVFTGKSMISVEFQPLKIFKALERLIFVNLRNPCFAS